METGIVAKKTGSKAAGPAGRKAAGPAEREGPGTQVRIDAELAKKLKFIAIEDDETVSRILSRMIRDQVEREYQRVLDTLNRATPPAGEGPGRPGRGAKGGGQ